jgi:hypothetical protein
MQLNLALPEEPHRPDRPQAPSSAPWDLIDPQARAAALDILAGLMARMIAAPPNVVNATTGASDE